MCNKEYVNLRCMCFSLILCTSFTNCHIVSTRVLFQMQGDHSSCHRSSPCHMPRYSPSKEKLSNPRAIQLLEKTLRETYIYRNAQEFCRVRMLLWVLCIANIWLIHTFSVETPTQWNRSTTCCSYTSQS